MRDLREWVKRALVPLILVIIHPAAGAQFARVYLGSAADVRHRDLPELTAASPVVNQRRWAWRILQNLTEGQTPKWLTWYDHNEIVQVFRELYPLLSQAEVAGQPVDDRRIQQAFKLWLLRPRHDPSWSELEFQEFVNGLTSPELRLGIRGVPFVLYNETAARHLLKYFFAVTECYRSSRNFPADDAKDFAPCFPQPFPKTAKVLKLKWVRLHPAIARQDFLMGIADFQRRAAKGWEWDGVPYLEEKYPLKAQVFTGQVYALESVHLMSKWLTHWVWVSAWWTQPHNRVLGADRPAGVNEKWLTNANMCATSSFTWSEEELKGVAPAVKNLLRHLWKENSGASWCSNPHLELGAGNARTNCAGCHQYAGLRLQPDALLKSSWPKPSLILEPQRKNFPADYLWSFEHGETAIVPRLNEWREYFETKWDWRRLRL
jgi:hypothetical protein